LLEGGEGPPIVLLRGHAASRRIGCRSSRTPWGGIGSSPPTFPALGNQWYGWGGWTLAAWLSDLIAQTCAEPPTLVGFSLGGSLAARFAVDHGDRARRIVLVNSGGLGRVGPVPGAPVALVKYSMHRSSL
jgi:pimeloyl-ACP methyl ester carboxylesterase